MYKRIFSVGTLVVLLLALALGQTQAAPELQVSPPGRLTYQGHLMDDAGNAAPDGDYVMSFAFYDAPTGGTLLWGPEIHTVSVDDAYFTALLGRDDAIDSSDLAATTYLEITVSGETMAPRHLLTSVAFALVAGECVGGGGGGWSLTGNSGTSAGTNFVGTTDDEDLYLAANNIVGLRLEYVPPDPGEVGATINFVAGVSQTVASYSGITIGGGVENSGTSTGATVSGGFNNTSSQYSVVGGGKFNEADGVYSTIGGGYENEVPDSWATVGGGRENVAAATYATIGGGLSNVANDEYSTIGGGTGNTVAADSYGSASTIGGGENNVVSNTHSTVGGGLGNSAVMDYATVSGGRENTANGLYSVVPGGYANNAAGTSSFAAGHEANALHDGAFVWADNAFASGLDSTADNQFIVRASGGISMYTNGGATTGATLAPGSGSWSSMSDRRLKENLEPVDGQAILDALLWLDVSTWNYVSQDDDVRHIGPMAQDFYATFGLGEGDTTISTIDADGVTLAALQALYLRVLELEAQVAECQCGGE